MNGAESLVRTLVAGGVDVCFTNPGTSEMHFVAALDRVEGMCCVLDAFLKTHWTTTATRWLAAAT